MSIDARQIIIQAITPANAAIATGDTVEQIAGKAQGQIAANSLSISKINSNRIGAFGSKKIAAFGARVPYDGTQVSNGTQTVETSRVKFTANGAISDLSVLFMNCQRAGSQPGTVRADITLTASLEYPAGTFTQITFNNGNTSYLLKWNTLINTDALFMEIPASTDFWVRTCVTVTAGQIWLKPYPTGGANEGVTANSDVTMSGTVTNSTGFTYSPTAVIGTATARGMSVLQLGDSIASGQNDTGNSTYKYFMGSGGLFGRLFGNSFNNLCTNVPGEALSWWIPSARKYYAPLFALCDIFICQLGVNDITNGATLATLQANYIALWDSLLGRGLRGYQTTITPHTTSTDSWATTTNQTLFNSAGEAVRVNINTWIRDGAPINISTRAAVAAGDNSATTIRAGATGHPLLGYFEVTDIVESARNSGIWKAGYSGDGLHPTSTGYTAAAAAFDVTKFNQW